MPLEASVEIPDVESLMAAPLYELRWGSAISMAKVMTPTPRKDNFANPFNQLMQASQACV